MQFKQCDHHVHKPCLEDIFRSKNECPLCDKKILLGYERCLTQKKMATNKVLKKKQTVDQNLKLAMIKEQEEAENAKTMSFGVNGTRLQGALVEE